MCGRERLCICTYEHDYKFPYDTLTLDISHYWPWRFD